MAKYLDLVDIIEQSAVYTKPKRLGYSDFDDEPVSQWDEIGEPKMIDESEITEEEINAILKEARLKLIKRIHQEREKAKKKTS